MTLTERKTKRYHVLAEQAPAWASLDHAWSAAHPIDPRWYQAREIDDHLVAGRTDDTISEQAYHALCVAFVRLYAALP